MTTQLVSNLSNEEAARLLEMPKWVRDGSIRNPIPLPTYHMSITPPVKIYLKLLSEDGENSFLMAIKQSKKRELKFSLHHQESHGNTGLLRIDFRGGHHNPSEVTDSVPEKLRSYAGKRFPKDSCHIHYHVKGYRSLAWALPLDADEFSIKRIAEQQDIDKTVREFGRIISLQTQLIHTGLLHIENGSDSIH